jgi:MFS family permease
MPDTMPEAHDSAPAHPAVAPSRALVFAGVAYAFLITMAGTTLPTPLYVLYRARFGFSEFMVTVIFATYAAGVIAALLLFGRLSDDIGRRRALVPGIALSALSAVAFVLAHGLALLLVGRVLSGLSAGIFTGTATATLVDLAPADGKARATLVAAMANMGGLGLGPLLSGLLVEWAGLKLRLAFWADLALLVPALAAVLLVPEPPPAQRRLRVRPQALSVPSEIRPTFIRAAMAGFAGFAVLGMFTAVSPAFLAGLLHERSHAVLGVIVCVVFVSSTVGQLALNRVSSSAALPLGSGGLILGALLIALSLALSSLVLLVLGGIVAGFGQGLSFRAGLAALNAGAPAEHRAEVASSFFVVAYVALSIPVIGVGILTQAAGLRAAGLVFTLAVAALAAAVLILVSTRGRTRVAA